MNDRGNQTFMIIYLLIISLCGVTFAFPKGAHFGNKFVLAFPKGGQLPDTEKKAVLELHMSSYENVEVRIRTRPKSDEGSQGKVDDKFQVLANSHKTYKLHWVMQENVLSYKFTENVIEVTVTNGKIVLYAMNTPNTGGSDGFLVLPVDALSTTYYFAFWKFGFTHSSTALIVNAHDGDEGNDVTIHTVGASLKEWINFDDKNTVYLDDTFAFKLERFELFVLTQTTTKGYYCIASEFPVAVILGTRWTTHSKDAESPDFGHMVEMIPPNKQWGRHVAVGSIGAPAKMLVLRVNTTDGSGVVQEDLSDYQSDVTSMKRAMVMLIEGKRPVLSYVPPSVQYLRYFMFITPSSLHTNRYGPAKERQYTNYISIYVMRRHANTLEIDGNSIPTKIPDGETSEELHHIKLKVEEGVHVIIQNDRNAQFAIIVHGVNDRGDGYAYPGGLRHAETGDFCKAQTDKMTPGNGIDDDCDGKVDEEEPDGADNDNDGSIDEDTFIENPDYLSDIPRKIYKGEAVGGSVLEPGMRVATIALISVSSVVLVAAVIVIVVLAVRNKRAVKAEIQHLLHSKGKGNAPDKATDLGVLASVKKEAPKDPGPSVSVSKDPALEAAVPAPVGQTEQPSAETPDITLTIFSDDASELESVAMSTTTGGVI